jgi:hypothetical protein
MKRVLIFLFIAFAVTSCFSPSMKLREIKFKPGMQEIVNKYKSELKPEIFATSPAWSRFDTIETHKVIVTIVNPEKLPGNDSDLHELAKNIAKDVYQQIENKTDYSVIEIVFRNKKGASLVSVQMTRNYPFLYEELEESDKKE